MSLTSGYFLSALAVLAVGSLVATVVLWRPLSGSTPRHWAGRAGLIVTVQITGVALLAGVVNAQNDFFPTLGTLLGSSPSMGPIQQGAPSSGWTLMGAGNAGLVAIDHPVRTTAGSLWRDPHSAAYGPGVTLDATLTGSISRLTATDVRIWLPPQYSEPAYRGQDFPVLTILTGYPGSTVAWFQGGHLPQLVETAISGGSIRPFVVAVVNPDIDPPRDTECSNVVGGPQAQTFLSSDLPIDLEHLLRVTDRGQGWALMGDSTGGYCAALLGLRYPKEFPTVVSLGGYFRPITDFTTGNLDGHSALHRDLRDPMWLLAHRPPVRAAFLLAGATGDSSTVPALQAFAAAARPPTTVATLVAHGGGHNWTTWSTQVPAALGWIGTRWRTLVTPRANMVAALGH